MKRKIICFFLIACCLLPLFGCSNKDDNSSGSDLDGAPTESMDPSEGEERIEILEVDGTAWGIPRRKDFLDNPYIYEMMPSGERRQLDISLLPEMLDGAESVSIMNFHFSNNQWRFTLKVGKYPGHPTPCFYNFYLNESEKQWVWDDPEWQIPEGVSEVAFLDYVQSFSTILYLPEEYYHSEDGLHDLNSIYGLIFEAAWFDKKPGEEYASYRHTVSFDKINKMAEYLYDDANFNIEIYLDDVGWLHNVGENELTVSYRRDILDMFALTYVLEATLLDSQDIEVISVIIFNNDLPGSSWGDEGVPEPVYVRRIYSPTTVDDTVFFTLLFLEELDETPQLADEVAALELIKYDFEIPLN